MEDLNNSVSPEARADNLDEEDDEFQDDQDGKT
jgi:hypothetical protein